MSTSYQIEEDGLCAGVAVHMGLFHIIDLDYQEMWPCIQLSAVV